MQMPAETPPTERRRFRWYHPLLVVLGGLIGATLIGAVAVVAIYGTDVEEIPLEANFWLILPAQMLSQLVVLFLISRAFGSASMERDYAFSVQPKDALYIIGGPIAGIGLGLISTLIRLALGLDEENPQALLDQVRDLRGTVTVLAIVLGIVVLGPVIEELTFRGLTFTTALDYGLTPRNASFVAAFVFALAHAVDPALLTPEGLVTLAGLLFLGVVLGELRIRTGRIGPSIFVHSGFNMMTVILLLFTDV